MKNFNKVEELAKESGFEVNQITTGQNGFPENLRKCITGFNTYDEAAEFAANTGGEVTSIRRRDGWKYYESEGAAAGPFDVMAGKSQDCVDAEIVSRTDLEDYIADTKDLLQQMLEDCETSADFHDFTKSVIAFENVVTVVESLSEDEFAVVINNTIGIFDKWATFYRDDVWERQIAVEYNNLKA